MKYGYMRVSTQIKNSEYGRNQTFDRQELILKEQGVEEKNIYRERISGGVSTRNRVEWEKLMAIATSGDMIIVTEMSRLARSLGDLIETVNMLIKRGIGIHFIKEQIKVGNDGMDAMNKLMFNMFGAFAEFEKNIISDRTKQGLQAKKAMGVVLGKPSSISKEIKEEIISLRKSGLSLVGIKEHIGLDLSLSQISRICKGSD